MKRIDLLEENRAVSRSSLIIISAFVFCLPSIAAGQDDCPGDSTGERRFAGGFISSLPHITGTELRQGKFVLKERMDRFGGSLIHTGEFTISFMSRGKVIFQKTVRKPAFISDDISCTQDISPVTENGVIALYFSYECGQGRISTGCFILVYPRLESGNAVSWQYKIEGYEGANRRFRKRRKSRRS